MQSLIQSYYSPPTPFRRLEFLRGICTVFSDLPRQNEQATRRTLFFLFSSTCGIINYIFF